MQRLQSSVKYHDIFFEVAQIKKHIEELSKNYTEKNTKTGSNY